MGTALAAKRFRHSPQSAAAAAGARISKWTAPGVRAPVHLLEVIDALDGDGDESPSGGSEALGRTRTGEEFSPVLPGSCPVEPLGASEGDPGLADCQTAAESVGGTPHPTSSAEAFDVEAHKKCKRLEKFLETHAEAPSISLKPSTVHPITTQLAARMTVMYERWMALDEPCRTGWLAKIVLSARFEFLVGLTIFAHSVFTSNALEGQLRRRDSGSPADGVGEAFFLTLFTMEVVARMCVHRLYFFVNDDMGWNLFDFVLVGSSLLHKLASASMQEGLGITVVARPLRILRIAKLLRVFKAFRFLKQLRVIAVSLVGSCMSLMWPMAMLILILYIFSTFFVQQMALQIEADSVSEEQLKSFGSVSAAMLTLGMCTTGGKDWADVYELVVPLGSHVEVALLFYIAFYTFGAMNIITGIFVESALRVDDDEEEKLQEVQQKLREDAAELSCLLSRMDTSGDGFLAMNEFIEAMRDERFIHVLNRLGLNVKDSKLFFMTVACMSQHDVVRIPEFVDLVVRMRGPASSADLNSLILKTSLLSRSVSEWREESVEWMQELMRRISPLEKPSFLARSTSGLSEAAQPKRAALFDAIKRSTSNLVVGEATHTSEDF